MIDLQDIITTKRELLSRETYSRNPINYSAGMAEDQKERYIQYLAEQNQDLRLTSDAMKLVLEDFMAQMKDLKAQVSSMESKHADLENRLSEEHKLRKSAERKIKSEVETIALRNCWQRRLEKSSFVTLMPTLPSSASKFAARLRAPE